MTTPTGGDMAEQLVWQSRCELAETARDAAERFVREVFGTERHIRWGESPGEFRFADGYWCYRIAFNGGQWTVVRIDKLTPQGKARAKARRETRQ